jgi:transcriptional regulator with XRE-family HTH domain
MTTCLVTDDTRPPPWPQERLAEHANLDCSYVAGIELGNRNRSLKALEQLASALHVRVAELFDD